MSEQKSGKEVTSDPVALFFQPGSNWDVLLPGTTPGLNINAEFVPMIFAPSYLDNEFKLQDGWRMLLGYNEPDHVDPSVAVKTTPEVAAAAWVELAKLRTGGTKLVAPAIANDLDWLKKWFSLIPEGTKPDYLAIHVYTTTFDSFKAKVEEYYHTFGLPIIVTEFAMTSFDANVPPPQSQQQVHDFMGQTTAWLDATPWIERFAWFGAVRDAYNLHGVHEFNRLMDQTGVLTPLM
ncbi:uncharacterized protein EHS24_009200 [Apiotrichum porosum]|uniref:Asl1-like glycosyl hydrolase catalytic domain-containing protein n=1 Tax=Apiotrichum porosum TaxID=105984 RepID=A0A427XP58_9TREE|nr:uncharacterized protein EHS24_009200 [Apiotrichum porosum]RSH80618.1 hypothetical protein EHS24_009200 [Apiotrichum porosum]